MLDLSHLPSSADVTRISVAKIASGVYSTKWHKRRSASWVYIFALGSGGNGGNGAGGGASYASGGGGGSGGQTTVLINAAFIPDILHVTNATSTVTSVGFDNVLNLHGLLVRANQGGNGGNATTTTAGAAGSAGTVSTVAQAPRIGAGFYNFLAGQAGASNTSLNFPTTGLRVTGGASGGAAGAAGGTGSGGNPVVFISTQQLLTGFQNFGGVGGANGVAGSPGNGGRVFSDDLLFVGGAGGGGSGGSGAVAGGRGGDCSNTPGCGGGGGGGGFGSGGSGGLGGPGLVYIAQW